MTVPKAMRLFSLLEDMIPFGILAIHLPDDSDLVAVAHRCAYLAHVVLSGTSVSTSPLALVSLARACGCLYMSSGWSMIGPLTQISRTQPQACHKIHTFTHTRTHTLLIFAFGRDGASVTERERTSVLLSFWNIGNTCT
jgi:hypothetical protein